MAEVQYYLGGVGPLFFDDTDTYADGSGVFDAFAKGNQIYLSRAPLKDEEVVRLGDVVSIIVPLLPPFMSYFPNGYFVNGYFP